ncbi:MAG TPA: DUF4411 family protein [Bacteroidales bacterium]|nr:DUF4411 family protein [Bacteroidales bacterium]
MKVVIDTSSLLSLVRYYLPFDRNNILYNFIKSKIESKNILVLDKVYEECYYTAKGVVVNTLTYLSEKNNQVKTTDLLPNQKFFNQLENQFINGSVKNKLSEVEFEDRKNAFLDSADAKLLLYSLKNKAKEVVIVSEETESINDNKSFKKLPALCKILEIKIITLPEYLEKSEDIKFEFF